jgi:histone-lysine N-methyltransferase SETMAR
MEKTIEQRYTIKFCAKLNKSLAYTHQMIQEAYGDSALSYSQVSRWLKLFKNGREEVMLIVFFGAKGVVHKEFLPQGQTVSANYYVEVLDSLRNSVVRTRKENAATWQLHHDNAPSHSALCVQEFLAKHSLATLPQPSYSPDLAPADFFLFPRIKTALKGTRFGTIEAIQTAVTKALNKVPVDTFQDGYHAWKSCWQKCVDAQGEYFEEF